MHHSFTLRKGEQNDLIELQKLYVDTITTVCTADYDKQQIEVWTSGIENKQRWDEMITKQFVLVAQNENKIVGFATLDKGNYIDFFYIHKDHQRQGIANRLLAEIEAEARRLKQTDLISDISKTAKPFFEKNDFIVLAEQTIIKKGVNLSNYQMTKRLV
ncbi:putative N-acetyltransferase YafP [compost metagenome]